MKNSLKYWTKERCTEVALLCNSKTEFRTKYVSAYNNSWKFGWLYELCSHMAVLGNSRKRLVYAYEFSDNFVYVGITCNKKRRNKQHFEIGGAVYEHILQTKLHPIKKIISDGYVEVSEAQKLEYETVEKYLIGGQYLLNKMKTGGLGGNIIIWDKIKCINVAQTCKTRKEFSIKFSSAYISARKNGWLNEICSHMIYQRNPKNYWNFDNCKNAALECCNRFMYSRKYSGAYYIANKNNWVDIFYPKKQIDINI